MQSRMWLHVFLKGRLYAGIFDRVAIPNSGGDIERGGDSVVSVADRDGVFPAHHDQLSAVDLRYLAAGEIYYLGVG